MNYQQYKTTEEVRRYSFGTSCKDLASAANEFKLAIVKAMIKQEDANDSSVRKFLVECNNFIRFWSEYAQNIQDTVRFIKPQPAKYGIPYSAVSKYAVDDNDYLSVLRFSSKLINEIKGNKIQSTDDVRKFYEDYVEKAFPEFGTSVAEVINLFAGTGYLNPELERTTLGDNEFMYFKNFRSTKIYSQSDRTSMCKAIDFTVDFISKASEYKANNDTNNMGIKIAKYNSIIDYVTQTLAVYAARIYVIGVYCGAYTNHKFLGEDNEDVTYSSEAVQYIDSDVIDVMRTTDEIMVRDLNRNDEFAEVLNKWVDELNHSSEYNAIEDALIGNQLAKFIDPGYVEWCDIENQEDAYKVRNKVREYLLNSDQALSVAVSPRQSMLTTIKEIKPKSETIDGYKDLGVDLANFGIRILRRVKDYSNGFINWRNRVMGSNPIRPSNPTANVTAAECARLLAEFYRDLSITILYKGREIESMINQLKEAKSKTIAAELKIEVPGMKPENISDNVMDTIVPDTTRDLDNIMESIAGEVDIGRELALLESYDIYAKSFPGMENDPYFTEAVDINTVINTALAKVIAWANSFGRFMGNQSVQRAFQWVEKHRDALNNIKLSEDSQMTVKKYKSVLENVGNTDKIITALNNVTLDSFKTTESRDRFIQTLYPNEIVAGWFMKGNDDQKKNAKSLYRKFILFYDIANMNNVDPNSEDPTEECNADMIKDYLIKRWVPIINGHRNVYNSQKSDTQKIRDAINNLKRRLISGTTTSTTSGTATSNANSDAAPSINAPEGKPSQTTGTAKPDESKKEDVNIQAAVAAITVAIENVYGSTIDFMIEYYRNIYSYIQTANSMAIKE